MMKKKLQFCVLFLITLCSCTGFSINNSVFIHRSKDRVFLRSIAVLPFSEKNISPKGSNYSECPITGFVTVSGALIPGSGDMLSKMIWAEMNSSGDDQNIIDWDISEKKIKEFISEKNLSYSLESTATAGKEMGVDAVIIGTILRYSERDGNAVAAKLPASAAFTVVLLDINNGTILWQARFDKSQKPLSENLLEVGSFVTGGMKWQSVEHLSSEGVKILIKDLKLFLQKHNKGGAEGRT